jgi:hypothetical protein
VRGRLDIVHGEVVLKFDLKADRRPPGFVILAIEIILQIDGDFRF